MTDVNTIGERAFSVRNEIRKTQVEMAKALGISTATWQKIERDEGTPSGETLLAFKTLGINPGWVLSGLGPRSLKDAEERELRVQIDQQTAQKLIDRIAEAAEGTSERSRIPSQLPRRRPSTFQYYALKASAGDGAVVIDEEGVPLDLETLSSELLGVSSAHIDLLTVKGDSMLPTLSDGDLVFVDRRKRRIEDIDEGAVYLVSIDGDLYVKRAHWSEDGVEVLEWISDNELFRPIRIEGAGYARMTLLGRIISLWHRL